MLLHVSVKEERKNFAFGEMRLNNNMMLFGQRLGGRIVRHLGKIHAEQATEDPDEAADEPKEAGAPADAA